MKKYLSFIIILFSICSITTAQKKVAVEYGTTWKNNQFIPFDSTYYTYNSDNYLTKKVRTLYLANQWRLTGKSEYKNNANGTVDVESYFVRNPNANSWELNYKTYHTYNADDHIELKESFILNNGKEELSTRFKYYYNKDKTLDSFEYYKTENGSIIRDAVTVYEYTGTGKLASTTKSSKRTNWVASDKWIYYYGFDDKLAKEENENFIGGSWVKISYYTFNYDSDDLLRKRLRKTSGNGTNVGEKFYKYQGEDAFLSVTNITKENNTTLYPNPVTDIATLSWDIEGEYSVKITDISGRTVKTIQNITDKHVTIDGSTLKKGIYFYTLQNTNNGKLTTGKFIISN